VTLYVLQIETPIFEAAESRVSPTLNQDLRLQADGLARLAGAARGAVFRLTGGDPYPFQRIAREISGYYLLAFEANGADRDGRTHRIAVRVHPRGTTVRARTAFRITKPLPGTLSIEDEIVRLLRTPRLATELPLRVATYSYADPQTNKMRMVVSAEAAADGPGAVTLGLVLVDARGVIVSSAVHSAASGRYAFPATVDAGRYLLRAAAIDAGGRKGSVQRWVRAGVTDAGRWRVSDLTLVEPTGDPSAPFHPTIDSARRDRIVAHLELYESGGGPMPEVRVIVDVRARDGVSPLLRADASLARPSAAQVIARADLRIGTLPPGAYVVRAIVAAPGGPEHEIARPLTITK
jgi:hypothetical protein